MSTADEDQLARPAIEIEPELRARVEAAAAERGLSVQDYVAAVLRLAVERHGENGTSGQAREWSQLSAPAFARDWESDADAVYDDLTERRRRPRSDRSMDRRLRADAWWFTTRGGG